LLCSDGAVFQLQRRPAKREPRCFCLPSQRNRQLRHRADRPTRTVGQTISVQFFTMWYIVLGPTPALPARRKSNIGCHMKAVSQVSLMWKRVCVRIALILLLVVGVIALASVEFSTNSHAIRLHSSTASGIDQPFVPGEVLVRYRSESVALAREGMIELVTLNGVKLSVRVERSHAS